MLLRHYLEQGVSKSALARKLGIRRDTIYRWIRSGQLERDLDAEPVRYKARPPVPQKLDPYKPMNPRRATSRWARGPAPPPLDGVPVGRSGRAR